MFPKTEHRSHKRLNNRAENAHQPTCRKEKCLIKFKSPQGTQHTLSLMSKVRNLFSVAVGRYTKNADEQGVAFNYAQLIWNDAARMLLAA